jgi:lambda family phage portal protein
MARTPRTKNQVQRPQTGAALVPANAPEPLEGASSTSREMARYQPRQVSPDRAINSVKPLADARALDMTMNDGNVRGAQNAFKDGIVGAQYRLNSMPNWRVLQRALGPAFDETWAEEFQITVESVFNLLSESEECWLDAERKKTFTDMIRLGVGTHFFSGEIVATAEWIREVDRPFNTAVQMISPARLSNPNYGADTFYLRRGVKRDDRGRDIGYYIQSQFPGSHYADGPRAMDWKYIPARKPWGRRQVLHIIQQDQPDQTRGVSEMLAVLKQMRMTKKFSEVTLQNAIVNATYAAAIESELPSEAIRAAMGDAGSPEAFMNAYGAYIQGIQGFYAESKGLMLDGVKIPHFFPGTKLNFKSLGTPGGVGTDYEVSLLRHIASGLNISYEEFTRDFSKGNYSSLMAALNRSALGMRSRKKSVADRLANGVFVLWLEEWINAGLAPMPRAYQGAGAGGAFYAAMCKEAFSACSWIGAAVGQIDQLKETQAALLRIAGGLSTYEIELGKLGLDWREVMANKAREKKVINELGLTLSTDATAKNSQDGQNTMNQGADEREEEDA